MTSDLIKRLRDEADYCRRFFDNYLIEELERDRITAVLYEAADALDGKDEIIMRLIARLDILEHKLRDL